MITPVIRSRNLIQIVFQKILYAPQMILSVLSATAYAEKASGTPTLALVMHIFSWLAQFGGHGFAEGRAPALLDNLLGGVFLSFILSLSY